MLSIGPSSTLADVLGIDLELSVAEHPVGSFSLDLLGRDLTNDCVLIAENQLTPTDHDHLGKLLTYAAGTDAQTVVWVAPTFREEHRQALDLLNDLGGERVRFFGVELGVIRVGDSSPAPLLELRAQPNDWHSRVSAVARATSQSTGKPALYIEYWDRFLERVRSEHPEWTKARKPGPANWLAMPCPFKGGPFYSFSFAWGRKIRSELYIDYSDPEQASALFNALESRRDRIEHLYGSSLSWEPLPDKRASRIADYGAGDVALLEEHGACMDWFFERGARLRTAISGVAPEVQELLSGQLP
jgi:Domain of unknown function (DUF4268)